jgi:hypothetical protein
VSVQHYRHEYERGQGDAWSSFFYFNVFADEQGMPIVRAWIERIPEWKRRRARCEMAPERRYNYCIVNSPRPIEIIEKPISGNTGGNGMVIQPDSGKSGSARW